MVARPGIASMGPPPFDGGNLRAVVLHATAGTHASMGPPPFDGGNTGRGLRGRRTRLRFNGATAFRRWKLGAEAGIAGHVLEGFNGATAFRRWKPGR